MQNDIKKIEKTGIKIVGISYDSVEILKEFSDQKKITFPLLSDPESKTIIAYSLKNQETIKKKFGKIDLNGIPYPGTILIDKTGTIRAKLFIDDFKKRHSVEELIKTAEGLKKE